MKPLSIPIPERADVVALWQGARHRATAAAAAMRARLAPLRAPLRALPLPEPLTLPPRVVVPPVVPATPGVPASPPNAREGRGASILRGARGVADLRPTAPLAAPTIDRGADPTTITQQLPAALVAAVRGAQSAPTPSPTPMIDLTAAGTVAAKLPGIATRALARVQFLEQEAAAQAQRADAQEARANAAEAQLQDVLTASDALSALDAQLPAAGKETTPPAVPTFNANPAA